MTRSKHRKVAPSTGLTHQEGPRDRGPFGGGPTVGRAPFTRRKVPTMSRVPVPSIRHTAPRRGASRRMRGSWLLGGAFVLSGRTPILTSDEGDGMT